MGFLDRLLGRGKEMAGDVAEKGKEVGGRVADEVGDVAEKGKDIAGDAVDKVTGREPESPEDEPGSGTGTS